MSGKLRFDDRVVIVTGAGNGLGRTHALLFASRGAKVVVNDLGGDPFGSGESASAADKVVAEIKEAGGEAVANYDSVEFGEKVVQTAIDTWGRVDVVVNNAGILRDTSFQKMTQADWDLVYKVHVLGSFKMSHAAWPHMREQNYGRIVMTASAAGIYGNFGQANYSMAKLGIAGLANTLAIEGSRRNIMVNTIAPLAGSRLTETVLPKNLVDALAPEAVSPLVALLAHESCEESGGLFEVGGGFFAKLRWERTKGKMFRVGLPISMEAVAKAWPKITDFSDTTHPADVASSLGVVLENVNRGPGKGGNKYINVDEALGYEFPEQKSRYDERDLSIYALGVGAGADPTDNSDLQLLYENHGDGFRALPTYGVIPAVNITLGMAQKGITAPGMNYGLDRILHGEQYTELVRPLPPSQKLTHKIKVKDIWDKGKGALVVTETKSYDEDGDLLMVNHLTAFIRGAGGWGGERGPSEPVNVPPERAPDATVEEKIGDGQALLYRLSGDWNPLHVDQRFAKAFGFERPILHGLCTFGYAGRHVINTFCDGDPRYFKSIKVRFADSVYPGETLVTEMWKESDTRIVFRTKVVDRDSVVLSHAAIELYEEVPKKKEKPKKKAATTSKGGGAAELTSGVIFTAIGAYVSKHPELVGEVGSSYLFKLTGPDSAWTVDLSSGAGSVSPGLVGKPACTLELSDADFLDMTGGKADPQKLYFAGKLKISGDVMASQKLTFLQKVDKADVAAALAESGGGAGGGGDDAAPSGPTSNAIFTAIGAYVTKHPELVGQVGSSYLFKLTDPASAWTVDLSSGAGSVAAGVVGKPACTLELSDADFMDMTSGKADPQKLYFSGKLKISGDVMASQKLTFLQKVDPKEVEKALKESAGKPAAAPVAAAPAREPAAPAIFAKLAKRLAEAPELADEVQATIRFSISDPEAHWVVDLSSKPGAVIEGELHSTLEITTTLSLSDEDLEALASGEAAARDLFQRARLSVAGDITVAHRLGFLNSLA